MISTLNNFRYNKSEPLYNNENIEKIKDYIRTGKLPDDLTDIQMKRFIQRFKYGYTLNNGKVYYKHLELVSNENMNEKLKEIYDDPNLGLGLGIVSFYKIVKDKYIGITRDDVEKFIKNQTVYQITKEPKRGVNKPIITTYPNERWAIDLVDMKIYEKYNNRYKQILTCIDYFTKYVWAEPLRDTQSESVKDAMEKITNESNTRPKILQSDNGSEFKGALSEWTHRHHIDQIKTLSYSPTSNGLIENFNKQLRKMIREGTIRYNSLNWVEHLQEYTTNHNHHKNTTTKYSPSELWKEGNEKVDGGKYVVQDGVEYVNENGEMIKNDVSDITDDNELKILRASERIKKVARRNLARTVVEKFKNGDKVRVLMSSLYSKIRKRIKKGDGKLLISKYTPEIYSVVEAPEPKGEHAEFMKPRYMLKDSDGRLVRTELKKNNPDANRSAKQFFGSELLRVGDNVDDIMTNKDFNNHDANLINLGKFDEFVKLHKKKKPRIKKIILDEDEDEEKIDERPEDLIPEEIPIKRNRKKNPDIFNDDFVSPDDVIVPPPAPLDVRPVKKIKQKKNVEPLPQPSRQPSSRARNKNQKYFGDDYDNN